MTNLNQGGQADTITIYFFLFCLTFKLYLKASSMFFSQTFLIPLNVHIIGITKLILPGLKTDTKPKKNYLTSLI
jgi:hypothetical protein